MCFEITMSLLLTLATLYSCNTVCDEDTAEKWKYFMTAPCQRSTMKVLVDADYGNVEQCESLASRKRGMAFAFSPKDRYETRKLNDGVAPKSCLVFVCPEVENTTSLVADGRYDYYSAFADPIPPPNATCIQGLGVFVYHLVRQDYKSSKNSCSEFGAELADVATELRTEKLSEHFSTLFRHGELYVGMDDTENAGKFLRSNGKMLQCVSYRAWAPGNPKKNSEKKHNCVSLDANRMWHSVECAKKLFFLCEISPGGFEYDYYDNEYSEYCTED